MSITVVTDKPSTIAASDALAMDVDERQYEAGHGPCLDAARLGEMVLVADLAQETRWPTYIPRARAAGVAASLAIPLRREAVQIGSLNIYFGSTGLLNDEVVDGARTFAGVAAIAIANAISYERTADQARHVELAMQSRAVIEQAKGILIERHHCSADTAFDLLVQLSQNSNCKLRDVAAAIVNNEAGTSAPGSAND